MKIAYFDCFAGAGGDMILGALMDAGVEAEYLKAELAKLHLSHFDLRKEESVKKGIRGTQAIVIVDEEHHSHHHRHLSDIRDIIEKSGLKESVRRKSMEIFMRLAQAEAKVHGIDIEDVHFHEVGAMDAIIDVTGSVAGLDALGIEKIFCSPLHVGSGTVKCAHGILPVPAPATAELIKGIPVYSTGVRGELLTPTAAAILTTLCSEFGHIPAMTIERIGYGAGTSDPAIPNLLRLCIGESVEQVKDYETEQIAVIETNIDDMNPQFYDYLMQKIMTSGAMDMFLSPVQMKKNRPGTLITVLCPRNKVETISDFLMRESTTIGVRWRIDNRIKAQRSIRTVQTPYGAIRVKLAQVSGEVINISPEYEDCKRAAIEHNVPIKDVADQARRAYSEK